MPPLLQIFAASQHLSDVLIRDPEAYDLLRLTRVNRWPGNRWCRRRGRGGGTGSRPGGAPALRRFKLRETLRIAYGDIVRDQPVRTSRTEPNQ